MFDNLGQQIYNTLIANDRWTMFLDGLLVTLMIAGIAVLMGVVIGSVVAIAKVNALRNKRLKWLNVICDIPDGDSGHAGAGAASDYVLYYFCCCADRDGAICCGACIWY